MAKPIIAALRQRRDLKESVLHTAQELAHRASIYGVVRVSLRFLAWHCRCCKQTILNHLTKLIDLGIIRKGPLVRVRGSAFCEMNRYTFCIRWERSSAPSCTAQMCNSQISGRTLPQPEREKHAALRDELDNQKTMLRAFTPGSCFWQWTQEEMARLERLLAAPAIGEA